MKIIQDGVCVFSNVRRADSFFPRFRGFMLRKRPGEQEGILLENCGRVHTHFMRFVMDAVYLSADMTVLCCETIAPWRIGKKVEGAYHVLELAGGEGGRLNVGSKIEFSE